MAITIKHLNAIPEEDRAAAFDDFATASAARDWRTLMQTIGDWTATGELHSRGLVEEILEAERDYPIETGVLQ